MADEIEYKKKEFMFKGKKLEELQKLSIREFADLIGSRERRYILRNFQDIETFIARAKKKATKNKPIKTHNRTIVVVPEMVGMKIGIYTGRVFEMVEITGEMLGHKFGELATSRARIKHTKSGVGATKGTKAKSKK